MQLTDDKQHVFFNSNDRLGLAALLLAMVSRLHSLCSSTYLTLSRQLVHDRATIDAELSSAAPCPSPLHLLPTSPREHRASSLWHNQLTIDRAHLQEDLEMSAGHGCASWAIDNNNCYRSTSDTVSAISSIDTDHAECQGRRTGSSHIVEVQCKNCSLSKHSTRMCTTKKCQKNWRWEHTVGRKQLHVFSMC